MRIIVLVHASLVPPSENLDEDSIIGQPWSTEYYVISTLRELNHEVQPVGLTDDLSILRTAIEEFKPNLVFNLLEEFDGEANFDHYIVSYLEMLRIKYTGCNPRGLMLARDKALSKKIMKYHRIKTPDFLVFRRHQSIRIPSRLQFPLFVKTLNEEASLGISQESIVSNKEQLKKRIEYLFENFGTDVIAETFVKGREFYVGIYGNSSIKVLPPWELFFDNVPDHNPRIATRTVKWDLKYREKMGIRTGPASELESEHIREIQRICRRTYKSLELSGYARMDLRWDEDDGFHIIEANPNPDIGYGEEFADSAEHVGMDYPQLLKKILNLGLKW